MLGVVAGAINAVAIVCVIFGAEIFLSPTRLGHALERVPFLFAFAMKVLVYGGVITLVVGGGFGWRAVAAAPIWLGPDLAAAISAHIQTPVAPRAARTFLLVGFAIFVLQIGRLVGERTLRDIVFGRYHRSRMEERFFLFVDIAGSTPLTERIGPEAIHRFLGEVFRLASGPIDDHRGDVYQYVGDEVVITWLVTEGSTDARPVACFFAIEQALARFAPVFEREFGAVPRLHAALHAGPVITGEVGGSRRAIVYHGDVMNTTSRLEQATRDLERQSLVSGDALKRLADLDGFTREDLGPQRLRGRAASIHVYAVESKDSTNDDRRNEPNRLAKPS
ncbi:MAG TPA: adenylate/guanylate cyclase domain-containing protein [Caldimonas sp.]|jgi:adenylate cyclase